jgi:hypothetical protein
MVRQVGPRERLERTAPAVWQLTAIDVHSSFAWAELVTCPSGNPTGEQTSRLARRVAADLRAARWRLLSARLRLAAGDAFVALLRRSAREELETPDLVAGHRRPSEGVVLLVREQVPEGDNELARGRRGRDLRPATCAHALEEGAQRPGRTHHLPGDLTEHVPRLGRAGPGDVAVPDGATSRLAHPWVEAEVADELARRGEATEIADRGHEGRCRLHVDAGDAHQPQDSRPGKGLHGSVLSAHRVKSQGRPRTTSSSQLIGYIGVPAPVLPSTPCPASAILRRTSDGSFMPRQRRRVPFPRLSRHARRARRAPQLHTCRPPWCCRRCVIALGDRLRQALACEATELAP